jgi:hypothetical protein
MWFLAGEILKISMHYETNFQGCISINTWHGESISTATYLPRRMDDTDGIVTTLLVGIQRNRCSICGLHYDFKFSSSIQTESTAHSAFLSKCPGIPYTFIKATGT